MDTIITILGWIGFIWIVLTLCAFSLGIMLALWFCKNDIISWFKIKAESFFTVTLNRRDDYYGEYYGDDEDYYGQKMVSRFKDVKYLFYLTIVLIIIAAICWILDI